MRPWQQQELGEPLAGGEDSSASERVLGRRLNAAKRFRRIKGYREMPKLVASLLTRNGVIFRLKLRDQLAE